MLYGADCANASGARLNKALGMVECVPGVCDNNTLHGVDIDSCGMPHNLTQHSLAEYNITVHFQFKTYLYTPEADRRVLAHLAQMPRFDLLVLGSAEWASGQRPDEEAVRSSGGGTHAVGALHGTPHNN
jgi:hypothetical protein